MGKVVADSSQVKTEQRDAKRFPEIDEPLDDMRVDIVKPAGGYVSEAEQKYLGDLAFNEEWVTIEIHSASERDTANLTDFVSVNGEKPKILVNGKPVEFGYLPKNVPLTLQRKFVDALIRSKSDIVKTKVSHGQGGVTFNQLTRATHRTNSISLIEDKNPKGKEWFYRRLAQNF